jgi:hydroxylamine dehydrogenase
MKRVAFLVLGIGLFCSALPAATAELSSETEACLECHQIYTPGLVGDWEKSRHAKRSLSQALALPESQRRISIENLSDQDGDQLIGCYECHSLNPDKHKDNFDHFGYEINVVVSPEDCRSCHPVEVSQYTGSKKWHALDILTKNPLFDQMVGTITGHGGSVVHSVHPEKGVATDESCYACHGTEVTVDGLKIIDSQLGEIEVPNLQRWPNTGVGRINPDGSRGSCTSCHPRHSFSIEIARKPYTCSQCHLEPDVPAYNVWKESKHGNIVMSGFPKADYGAVPWRPGEDFTAPTCAACHNSLLVNPDGDVIAQRTHNFADRLWVRIFGLPYSHPQPDSGATFLLQNDDGQPLPVSLDGKPASQGLISQKEQSLRQELMTNVCKSCHGSTWAVSHFEKFHKINALADSAVADATAILTKAIEKGLTDPENLFDESLEILWVRHWLFYANSIRMATAMAGPDYSSFKNGWWEIQLNKRQMENELLRLGKNKEPEKKRWFQKK